MPTLMLLMINKQLFVATRAFSLVKPLQEENKTMLKRLIMVQDES